MKKLAILALSIFTLTACSMPENTDVIIHTSEGDIYVDLYQDQVPETTKNFLELSKAGKYNGVPFHRVINDFMIQTGDFENQNGTGGYSYKGPGTLLEDEFASGLTHTKGVLSMANRGPNTGGSQFFIVQADEGTPWLDGKHAIFGNVVKGIEIVDKIATVDTDAFDGPLEPIIINSVEIVE